MSNRRIIAISQRAALLFFIILALITYLRGHSQGHMLFGVLFSYVGINLPIFIDCFLVSCVMGVAIGLALWLQELKLVLLDRVNHVDANVWIPAFTGVSMGFIITGALTCLASISKQWADLAPICIMILFAGYLITCLIGTFMALTDDIVGYLDRFIKASGIRRAVLQMVKWIVAANINGKTT